MSGEEAVSAQGLRKSYGSVVALRGIDLSVPQGTVLGLLGPNGAGKTTAVRILTTLLPPDGGTAQVAGLDVVDEAAKLRSQIGLAGQYAAVDENLTGRENLEMVGRLYHLGGPESRKRAGELLERFDLTEAGKRMVRTYSGGMRRRLDLAAALVARPPVIFLDEPTTGLDPLSRLGLWETIEDRVAAGTTVLLTTQYLDEADRLADSIAVIDHGRVIAEGTSDQLKDRVGGERLEVTLESPAQAESGIAALAPMSEERPEAEDGTLRVAFRRRQGAIAEAVRRLDEAGVGVEDVAVRRPTLDDVFISLTGHAAEQDEEQPE
ncbi:MAG TPA: ATP-binding cassette domain-containing protein [Thermoleophilaceae bacterium]|nr:ATP-binding cassette domain-containing protein [Thermoleophilaceae bacterium]